MTAEYRALLKAAVDREIRRRLSDPRTIGPADWYEDRLIMEAHREMVRQQQTAALIERNRVSHERAEHRKRNRAYRQRLYDAGLTAKGKPRRAAA